MFKFVSVGYLVIETKFDLVRSRGDIPMTLFLSSAFLTVIAADIFVVKVVIGTLFSKNKLTASIIEVKNR
jgi:hypothetical protein